MRSIVVDTNCLVQMIPRLSPYRFIWDAYLCGEWQLCVSNDVLAEYTEILSQLASPTIAKGVVSVILNSPHTVNATPFYKFEIITRDRDDNKFVDLAIATSAHYLVTNDRHFTEVKQCQWPYVNVVSLDEFAKTIKSSTT